MEASNAIESGSQGSARSNFWIGVCVLAIGFCTALIAVRVLLF